MTGQDLEGFGGTAGVGRNNVEQDVGDDAPVEVEGDLSDEQHGEHDVDVRVGHEHPDGEEDCAEDDSDGTDEWVSPGVLLLQTCGENHAQWDTHNPGHHGHDTKDQFNVPHVNLSVLLLLGKKAAPDEVWTKPGESSEAESDAGKAQRREDEALVFGERDDVLLK